MDEGVLRDLLASNPRDEGAAEALIRILTDGERWEELVQLMLDRLDQPTGAKTSLYLRLAEVLHLQLGQSSDALVVLIEGLTETEDDGQLGDLIEQVATANDQWPAAS